MPKKPLISEIYGSDYTIPIKNKKNGLSDISKGNKAFINM
jgi:hypothetical protein